MEISPRSESARWFWVALFAMVTLALLAGGYAYYRSETERIRQEKYQEIAAIGKLKAQQIQQWRRERLGDISRSSKAPFFAQGLREWLRDMNNTALQAKLHQRLVFEQKEEGYADVLLIDTEYRVLLSAEPEPHPLTTAAKKVIEQALAQRAPMLSDLYRCPRGIVHVDAVGPLLDSENRPVAVLVLRSNAESYLYPLIQSWPTPSRTAETLLVRREGEEVLFLNDLRHRPKSALSLREPLTLSELPGVQAVLGKQGIFQGKDYRGVEVLADLRPIPQSPWFMVAKVDAAEILAEVRYRGGVIVLFCGLFILLAAGVTAYGYRYRQVRLYRDLYRSERETRMAQEEFRTTLYSIGDAVITTDTEGLVRQMNPVAEQLTGWLESEAKGHPLDKVFHIVNEESRGVIENPVQRVLRQGLVIGLANHTLLIAKDGVERPIADSGAPIRDESGAITGVVLVFRDQTNERAAEKALRESEERFRLAFHNANIGVCLVDAQGRLIRVNNQMCEILGYTQSELEGLSVNDITHSEDLDFSTDFIGRASSGEIDSGEFEKRYIHKDGYLVWGRVSSSIVRDESGAAKYFICHLRDITRRKKAEERLLRAKDQLQLAIEASGVGLWDWKVKTGEVWLNERWAQIIGYRLEELQPIDDKTFVRYSHPEDLNKSAEALEKHFRGDKESYECEARMLHKSGQWVWTSIRGKVVQWDPDGNPVRITGTLVDVTERKLGELSHRRLSTAVEQAAEAVVITDDAGNIQYVNPAFEKITGYTREEVLGEKPSLFTSEMYDEAFLNALSETLARGDSWAGRLQKKRKDGSPYEEDVTISPVRDSVGNITNFVAVERDITEEVLLQRQLIQAQKLEAIGTLAGGVAHDFNNLLQVVLGYSELILSDDGLDGRHRDDLKKIHQAAGDGADLVKRLLTFSRKAEANPKPLNLNLQIDKTKKMLSRTLPKMIEIQLILADDLATIYADPVQMEQILMNLAVNSRDAMPDGGRLVVETRNVHLDEDYSHVHLGAKPGQYVLVTVSDTGTGMDKETLEHVFEPFYTTKGPGEGTGLGLAMVYGIVKQHNGHIMCYSEPGKGTDFKLYFPAVVREIETQKEPSRSLPPGGTETILLVDDENLLLELGQRILTRAGYTVLTARNGKEALEVYQKEGNRIALVVLDLMMPEIGGKRCLEELLKVNPEARVLIASGYSLNGSTKATLKVAAKGFVAKPYDVRQLLETVRDVLDSSPGEEK